MQTSIINDRRGGLRVHLKLSRVFLANGYWVESVYSKEQNRHNFFLTLQVFRILNCQKPKSLLLNEYLHL